MITLINPPIYNPYPTKAIEPPIWCLYLASYLRNHGYEVNLVDMEADNLSLNDACNMIDGDAILVAMGSNPSASSTPKMPVVEAMLEKLPQARVAGLHPQAVKHPRLYQMPSQDELASLIPAWDLVELSKYRAHNWHCLGREKGNYGVIYTSFGCPFNCYYCNIHALYGGRKIVLRDALQIRTEIEILAEKGMKNLKLCDELFTLYPEHVNRVCDVLSAYNFNVWAYARVDTVNISMLHRMKRVGINWLAYGFESITDKKFIARTEDVIKMTRDAGISIIGNFMFGLPGDSIETMEVTLDWAEKQNFEYVNFYDAKPYPGSQWYEDKVFILGDTSKIAWSWWNQYNNESRGRQDAFRHYFSRPEYLEMIERKFKASDEIKEMLWRQN